MDMSALEGLLSHGIPAFYIDSGLTTEDYGWGTPNFRKMGLHKVERLIDSGLPSNCLLIIRPTIATMIA